MANIYHVDIPDWMQGWIGLPYRHIKDFSTKEEAIEFCKVEFGADENGSVNLISEDEDWRVDQEGKQEGVTKMLTVGEKRIFSKLKKRHSIGLVGLGKAKARELDVEYKVQGNFTIAILTHWTVEGRGGDVYVGVSKRSGRDLPNPILGQEIAFRNCLKEGVRI